MRKGRFFFSFFILSLMLMCETLYPRFIITGTAYAFRICFFVFPQQRNVFLFCTSSFTYLFDMWRFNGQNYYNLYPIDCQPVCCYFCTVGKPVTLIKVSVANMRKEPNKQTMFTESCKQNLLVLVSSNTCSWERKRWRGRWKEREGWQLQCHPFSPN